MDEGRHDRATDEVDAAAGRLAEELRRRNRELQLLNRLISAAVQGADPEEVAAVACRELAAFFELSRAFAFLITGRQAKPKVISEVAPDGDAAAGDDLFPAVVEALLEKLVEKRKPLTFGERRGDKRQASGGDLALKSIAGSLVLLPLLQGEEMIGGIGLVTRQGGELEPSQTELARRVADQLAGALVRARLERERRLLTAAVEQAGESVIITDAQGTLLYVNPTFERNAGYRREEVVGKNVRLLKSGDHEPGFYREVWETIAKGRVWNGRFLNRRKDGVPYVEEALISPVIEDGKTVSYVSLQRDVTHELEMEEQQRQSQKMDAVGRLAGGIAHDFNNLLMAIMGHAELALTCDGTPHPADSNIETIRKTAERAAELTSRLLTFTRRRIGAPQEIDLNRVIQDLDDMFRSLVADNVEIVVDLEPSLGRIWADPTEIEQVLVNLVVNAADAMPQGGRLLVGTCDVSPDMTGAPPGGVFGDYVRLRVWDTGVGIPEELRDKIFEPFFTTKGEGRGTGLGLATTWSIVRKLGGQIVCDSEVGRGTIFDVYFTRYERPPRPEPKPEPKVERPRTGTRGRETILFVEDNHPLRGVVTTVLESHGYSVLQAANGEEALELVAEMDEPAFDLLITDGIMPGMSGKDLAHHLDRAIPGLKVIVLSGYVDDAFSSLDELPRGAVLLEKPVSPPVLLERIRQILDGT